MDFEGLKKTIVKIKVLYIFLIFHLVKSLPLSTLLSFAERSRSGTAFLLLLKQNADQHKVLS